MMAANQKTFASRYPPNEKTHPEAKAAWVAMVTAFFESKLADRNTGRKRAWAQTMNQDMWWSMHGHDVAAAKQRKILKKPSATTSGRAGEEGVDAKACSSRSQSGEDEEEEMVDDVICDGCGMQLTEPDSWCACNYGTDEEEEDEEEDEEEEDEEEEGDEEEDAASRVQ